MQKAKNGKSSLTPKAMRRKKNKKKKKKLIGVWMAAM